jgi:hypothetical protein
MDHLAPVLDRLRETGAEVELFVGRFLERDGGDKLPSDLLGALAKLGLAFSLDVYEPDAPKGASP